MSILTHVAVGVGAGTVGFMAGVAVGKNFAKPLIDEENLQKFLKDIVDKAGSDVPKAIAKFKIAVEKEDIAERNLEKKAVDDSHKLLNDQYAELAKHVAPLLREKKEKAA